MKVDTTKYIKEYGKAPTGRGNWYFTASDGISRDGVSYKGTYVEAAIKAMRWANSLGLIGLRLDQSMQ